MKQMNWQTFQTKFPDKAANFPGGEQAYNQQLQTAHDNWANPGGMGKPPNQTALGLAGLLQQGGLGGGYQVPLQGESPKPVINQPSSNNYFRFPWGGMSEQMTGFGETLGGYGEQIGGFGEQMTGLEKSISGFTDQFQNLNNRLDSLEKGIAGLQQFQPQQSYNPYTSMMGMFNPYGGFSYGRRFA
jgi:hypothetical protein